jgi:hypothetical protein
MVRELIGREFAVRLSEVSVGRLLRKLGLSPQRPRYRAYQQNPEAVARWKAETYPAIRAEAARVGATVYFVDEAGVRCRRPQSPTSILEIPTIRAARRYDSPSRMTAATASRRTSRASGGLPPTVGGRDGSR